MNIRSPFAWLILHRQGAFFTCVLLHGSVPHSAAEPVRNGNFVLILFRLRDTIIIYVFKENFMGYTVEKKDFSKAMWICGSDAFLKNSEDVFYIENAKYIWPVYYCRVHMRKEFFAENNGTALVEIYCDNKFSLYVNGAKVADNTREYKGEISVVKGENRLNILAYQTDSDEYFTSALIGKITVDGKDIYTDETWKSYNPANFWCNEEPEDWMTTQKNYIGNRTLCADIHPRCIKRSLYMRKNFSCRRGLIKATLFVSDAGESEAYINGERTDCEVFPQGINEKYREYRELDVTHLIKTGENAIGFITANGWLNSQSHSEVYMNKNRVIAMLELEYSSGETETVVTDGTWKIAFSPLYDNDLQLGERYDARKEISGWCLPEFDASLWEYAETLGAKVEARPFVKRSYPPVYITRRIQPAGKKQAFGGILFDFNENCTGRFSLKIKDAVPGQKVRVNFFERFTPDGTPEYGVYGAVFFDKDSLAGGASPFNRKNCDVYFCRGGNETFEPHFAFTGFRYAVVEGLKEENIEHFEMTVMHNALKATGKIKSAYKFLPEFARATERTMYNNIVNGPMDCPTREKNFWTGDTQLFCTTACYLADQSEFLARWTDGGRKMCAQVYGWGDEIYIIPWTLYKFYRDRDLLRARYEEIIDYAEARIATAPEGLPKNPNSPFNDHLSPDRVNVAPDFFAGAYYCYMLKTVAEICEALGEYKAADRYVSLCETAKDEFMRKFFIPEENDFTPRSQTGLVLPLAFDIVPVNRQQLVARTLNSRILQEGHITCGYAGSRYIMDVLSDFGYVSTAFMLLDKSDFPSWKNILYSSPDGGSTVTESWRGYAGPFSGSMDHFTLGSVTGWMFEHLAGIRWQDSSPGFLHPVIRPDFIKEIGSFRAEFASRGGKITVDWHFEGNTVICNVETETSCTFIKPDKSVLSFEKGLNTVCIREPNN